MNTLTLPITSAPQLPAIADSLTAYLNFVNSVPRLSAAAEQKLAQRLRRDNDKAAAEKLALSNLRLVVAVAAGYRGYGLEQTDLIQEGNIGLLKAIRKFDPTRGARLATFAMYWIRAEMYEFIIRNWRIVKIATTKAQRKLFFNMRKLTGGGNSYRAADADAIAKELNVAPEDVREMRQRLHNTNIIALSADEEHVGGEAVLADESPAADAEYMLEERDKMRRLEEAMAHVSEREREIIKARYFSDPPKTLQTLAARHGISIERVRQIEAATIKKISRRVSPPSPAKSVPGALNAASAVSA